MRIGVIGTGLIGGSLALALRARGHEVVGYDADEAHGAEALRRGLVAALATPGEQAATCEVVAVCVPVDHVARVCAEVLALPGDATVIELSSTKAVLAEALRGHPARRRLVLTHPMAGTEYSGPAAAVPDLFAGKTVVLCDRDDADAARVERVADLYGAIGMRVTYQRSGPHDLHVAYVSHISHISSFALSLTVLEKERDERQIFDLASGGFASTVRLAKSSPATWRPIFEQNRDNVLDVLDEYINVLADFRTALIKRNFDHVGALMRRANDIAPLLPTRAEPPVAAAAPPPHRP